MCRGGRKQQETFRETTLRLSIRSATPSATYWTLSTARSMPLAACKVIKNMGTGNSRVALGFLFHGHALSFFLRCNPCFRSSLDGHRKCPRDLPLSEYFIPSETEMGWEGGREVGRERCTGGGDRTEGLDIRVFHGDAGWIFSSPPLSLVSRVQARICWSVSLPF